MPPYKRLLPSSSLVLAKRQGEIKHTIKRGEKESRVYPPPPARKGAYHLTLYAGEVPSDKFATTSTQTK